MRGIAADTRECMQVLASIAACILNLWLHGTVFHDIGASALTNSFTEGNWYIHINDLNCTGNESSIWDCPMNELTDYSCYHYDDASVICQCMYNSLPHH